MSTKFDKREHEKLYKTLLRMGYGDQVGPVDQSYQRKKWQEMFDTIGPDSPPGVC